MSRDLLLRKRILKKLAKESVHSVTELASSLERHRSSVSRSLHQLKSLGLVEKNSNWELTIAGKKEASEVVLPDKDITSQVHIYGYDEEIATLTKCACEQSFEPWEFNLSIYRDDPKECPSCHRKLYCSICVKVHEVRE